jgi:hypothetical protein
MKKKTRTKVTVIFKGQTDQEEEINKTKKIRSKVRNGDHKNLSFMQTKGGKSFSFLFLFPLYCCARWEYIVAFTKFLPMYQIYHTWIHSLNHSPLCSSPESWNSFNRYNFCIYIHVYTVFAPYSPSYSFSLPPPPPTGTNPPLLV